MNGVKRLIGGVLASPALTYGLFYGMEASHQYHVCNQLARQVLDRSLCKQSVFESTNNEITNFPWPYAGTTILVGLAIGLTPIGKD